MINNSILIDHPYNNPEYVSKVLEHFKCVSWAGRTFSDVIDSYRSSLFTIPVYPLKMKKGTVVFRARRNPYRQETLFNHLSEIGIKDAKLVKSFGRANIPGESVFYASTNEETVVREVTQWYINDTGRAQDLVTKGVMDMGWSPFTSMMTVSAWCVEEDLNLALLFGNEEKRCDAIRQCEIDRREPKNDSESYCQSKNLILDFFSNEFGKLDVKHENEYLYSAYYAYEVFRNTQTDHPSEKFDGVKYASVANNFKGENIAISEYAFRRKMRFLGANYCYTLNNYSGQVENEGSALIGRVYAAVQLRDNSFEWVKCENDCNFLIRVGSEYKKLLFPSSGSKFPLVVTSIGENVKT